MNKGLTVERQFSVGKERRGRQRIRRGRHSLPTPAGVPRISRLMALAIRFDQLLRDGVVADQAELAHRGHVTRARLTQIMNLLNLAPGIQEELLSLQQRNHGRDRLTERVLRAIVAEPDWRKQRRMWLSQCQIPAK